MCHKERKRVVYLNNTKGKVGLTTYAVVARHSLPWVDDFLDVITSSLSKWSSLLMLSSLSKLSSLLMLSYLW